MSVNFLAYDPTMQLLDLLKRHNTNKIKCDLKTFSGTILYPRSYDKSPWPDTPKLRAWGLSGYCSEFYPLTIPPNCKIPPPNNPWNSSVKPILNPLIFNAMFKNLML